MAEDKNGGGPTLDLTEALKMLRGLGGEAVLRTALEAASAIDTSGLRAAVKGAKTTFIDPHLPPEVRDKAHAFIDSAFDLVEAARTEGKPASDLRAVLAACEAGAAGPAMFADVCELADEGELATIARRPPSGWPDWMQGPHLFAVANALADRRFPNWSRTMRANWARLASPDFKAERLEGEDEGAREVVRGEEHTCSAPTSHHALMGTLCKALILAKLREAAGACVRALPSP